MGNWYCKCGLRMSNGLTPTPHEYEVFTSKQCCDGDLDKQRPYADAYICPECGRIMIFGRNMDRYMLYRPEALEDLPMQDIDQTIEESEEEFAKTVDVVDASEAFKISHSFTDEAWNAYSELLGKEDDVSSKAIRDINQLISQIKSDGIRDLSIRNKMVGSEHQLCYRVFESVLEIISIEWIFG